MSCEIWCFTWKKRGKKIVLFAIRTYLPLDSNDFLDFQICSCIYDVMPAANFTEKNQVDPECTIFEGFAPRQKWPLITSLPGSSSVLWVTRIPYNSVHKLWWTGDTIIVYYLKAVWYWGPGYFPGAPSPRWTSNASHDKVKGPVITSHDDGKGSEWNKKKIEKKAQVLVKFDAVKLLFWVIVDGSIALGILIRWYYCWWRRGEVELGEVEG